MIKLLIVTIKKKLKVHTVIKVYIQIWRAIDPKNQVIGVHKKFMKISTHLKIITLMKILIHRWWQIINVN